MVALTSSPRGSSLSCSISIPGRDPAESEHQHGVSSCIETNLARIFLMLGTASTAVRLLLSRYWHPAHGMCKEPFVHAVLQGMNRSRDADPVSLRRTLCRKPNATPIGT